MPHESQMGNQHVTTSSHEFHTGNNSMILGNSDKRIS
jgi:pectate lyase